MASRRKTKTVPVSSPVAAPPKVSAPPAPIAAPPVPERSELKGLGKPKAPAATPRTITHEEIARRAHEIWASRGYALGDPTADWYEAERQLRAGL